MANDDDRRKRSKWDEPDRRVNDDYRGRDREEKDRYKEDRERASAARSSRWDDRRSRSPRRDSERSSRRSRSPPVSKSESPASAEAKREKLDPQAAAAAAAARIAASIHAKRGIQHVDVPPIITTSTKPLTPVSTTTFSKDMYIADGDYIKDIEVNDLRNRYLLTKGATQKMIKEETGADVTTRGAYYPDKSLATPQNPPLYLHVTSTTKEGLEKAVAKIEELMKQELPNLVDERRFRRQREQEQNIERDEFGRRKWPEEKIPIGLEPLPGFNLRASVVGHQGAYVKHIQQETRCRVQIKGRGSGFPEPGTGVESDEPLYLHVTGPDPKEVQHAKGLCEDLITSVKQQYEQFKSQPPPARFPGYGSNNHMSPRGNYGRYNQSQSPPPPPPLGPPPPPGGQPPPPPSTAPPPAPGAPGGSAAAHGAPGTSMNTADYAAQYQQYYGTADPYAAYGGYQAYLAYYTQYYQQMMAGGGAAGAPGATAGTLANPPPPPATSPPPPPPSASAPAPAYGRAPGL